MKDNRKKDPTSILQAAIEELTVFICPDASRLELGDDGRLIAAKGSHLEKVVGFARSYLGSFFSDQARYKQELKLSQLKQVVLHARDIVQSYSALIEKFKHGNDSQRKLAEYAIKAIQRYNEIVTDSSSSWTSHYDAYNYERNCLLHDQEIKGLQIELPRTVCIKYDSHPDTYFAHKMLKELSETLLGGAIQKQYSAMTPTHKKTAQFMVDTFRLKATRMIRYHLVQQNHLAQQMSVSDVVQLVKQTEIEIDDKTDQELIIMRQLLELGPGSVIFLSGCFKRNPSDPKFMTMPILDSFRLRAQSVHTGFPYPSQHTGWALSDKFVGANPLRIDQVPLFQQIDQRRKRVAEQLLFDQSFIYKAHGFYKLKREIFDQYRTLFVPMHRQLQEQLLRQGSTEDETKTRAVLDPFYQLIMEAPSAFDLLVHTQQQLFNLFVDLPLKALEDEWLENGESPLRMGTPQEKFQAACQKLEQQRKEKCQQLDPTHPRHAYILQQGNLIGQSIGLQYQSEKMGFAPPLLNDFERKLQVCAFQQLLSFLHDCDNCLDVLQADQMKKQLSMKWAKDLQLFQPSHTEEDNLAVSIANELEVYFNSRFYAFYPRVSNNIKTSE